MPKRKVPHPPRRCVRCGAVFSPFRSDTQYCSKLCVLRDFQGRNKKPKPSIDTLHSNRNPTYVSFRSMQSRCGDEDNERYGGRGIFVDPSWDRYEDFLRDMGPRPEGHTLDRVDVDGPYCRDNCRWATPEQQANNRSNSRLVSAFGETLSVTQWGRRLGIPAPTIFDRLYRGACPTAALLPKRLQGTQ